jgi:hypothetical protein
MKYLIPLILAASPVFAEAPVVETVVATQTSSGWRFDVTLLHPDTGWDHYADRWDILDQNGTKLGERVLAHPHVNEQPFTRSLSGVSIPEGTEYVTIIARCTHGDWSVESDPIPAN